jgi:uncharacterized membrane protein YeaQ/YmgE (transglycosylase-associated protein family)
MHILWFLLIGLFAGFLAGKIMRGRGFGLGGDLVIGVIGAYIGGYLFQWLGLNFHGSLGTLLSAMVGAMVLLFVIGLFKKV